MKMSQQTCIGCCAWDGSVAGEFASDGTYFIVVQFDNKVDNKVQTTSITLFRD